jgi:hypothetical protein
MSIVNKTNKQYRDYQIIDIINGIIHLKDHTLSKYKNVIDNVFNQYNSGNIKTIIDAGCSLGGIGLKLATLNGIEKVTLNNVTGSELNTAKEISHLCDISNVEFSYDNIFNITDSYDLTLYFALIHHLLRVKSISDILQMINIQTNMYTVMEIPIKGDALLNKIVQDSKIEDPWSDRYKALYTLDDLTSHISDVFDVLAVNKIEYGSGDLNRYSFVCKSRK